MFIRSIKHVISTVISSEIDQRSYFSVWPMLSSLSDPWKGVALQIYVEVLETEITALPGCSGWASPNKVVLSCPSTTEEKHVVPILQSLIPMNIVSVPTHVKDGLLAAVAKMSILSQAAIYKIDVLSPAIVRKLLRNLSATSPTKGCFSNISADDAVILLKYTLEDGCDIDSIADLYIFPLLNGTLTSISTYSIQTLVEDDIETNHAQTKSQKLLLSLPQLSGLVGLNSNHCCRPNISLLSTGEENGNGITDFEGNDTARVTADDITPFHLHVKASVGDVVLHEAVSSDPVLFGKLQAMLAKTKDNSLAILSTSGLVHLCERIFENNRIFTHDSSRPSVEWIAFVWEILFETMLTSIKRKNLAKNAVLLIGHLPLLVDEDDSPVVLNRASPKVLWSAQGLPSDVRDILKICGIKCVHEHLVASLPVHVSYETPCIARTSPEGIIYALKSLMTFEIAENETNTGSNKTSYICKPEECDVLLSYFATAYMSWSKDTRNMLKDIPLFQTVNHAYVLHCCKDTVGVSSESTIATNSTLKCSAGNPIIVSLRQDHKQFYLLPDCLNSSEILSVLPILKKDCYIHAKTASIRALLLQLEVQPKEVASILLEDVPLACAERYSDECDVSCQHSTNVQGDEFSTKCSISQTASSFSNPPKSNQSFSRTVTLNELSLAGKVLLENLPPQILTSKSNSISKQLSQHQIFPTQGGFLKSAPELFDPEVQELPDLIDISLFLPHSTIASSPSALNALRQLGLQRTFTVHHVVSLARTLDQSSFSKGRLSNQDRRRLSTCLMQYLNANWSLIFPTSGSLLSSLMRGIASWKTPTKQSKQEFFDELRCLKWMAAQQSTDIETSQKYLQSDARISLLGIPLLTDSNEQLFYSSQLCSQSILPLVSSSRLCAAVPVEVDELRKGLGLDEVHIEEVAQQLIAYCKLLELAAPIQIKNQLNSDNKVELKQNLGKSSTDTATPVGTATTTGMICFNGVVGDILQQVNNNINQIYARLNQELQNIEWEDRDPAWLNALREHSIIWCGQQFFPPSRVAYSCFVDLQPHFVTLSTSFRRFKTLFNRLLIPESFPAEKLLEYLSIIVDEKEGDPQVSKSLSQTELETVCAVLNHLAGENAFLKDIDDVPVPNDKSILCPAAILVYNDSMMAVPENFQQVHPTISNAVADAVGVRSLMEILLGNLDTGDPTSIYEPYGQEEKITARLRGLVDVYPDGPSIIKELCQNADDAGATQVSILYSERYYDCSSLFTKELAAWQGPALYIYNDSTFSAGDFDNLTSLANSSKLNDPASTGRFGVGFNSVYHFTDVPMIMSGNYFVILDPHRTHLPAAATSSRPGLRVKFTDKMLCKQFPDQFAPFIGRHGFTGTGESFPGTLFRFPLRNVQSARCSEIKPKSYCQTDISNLLTALQSHLYDLLLFTRNLIQVSIYVEPADGIQTRIALVRVSESTTVSALPPSLQKNSSLPSLMNQQMSTTWNDLLIAASHRKLDTDTFLEQLDVHLGSCMLMEKRLTLFIEDFYQNNKNGSNQLCKSVQDKVNECGLKVPDYLYDVTWLIAGSIGTGSALQMAKKEKHLTLRPWASIAVPISLMETETIEFLHLDQHQEDIPYTKKLSGKVFLTLPLPIDTPLPVHVNGYFEISTNRRDLWSGADLTGDGKTRSVRLFL